MNRLRLFSPISLIFSLLLLASCLVEEQNFVKGSQGDLIANPAPEEITHDKRLVTVAVVDSGVDYNHPRFKGLIQKNTTTTEGVGFDVLGHDSYPYPIVLNRETLEKVDQILISAEHGTHVAGLATLNGNLKSKTNKIVEYKKFHNYVRLLPIRILPVGLSDKESQELNSETQDILNASYETKFQQMTVKKLTQYMLASVAAIDAEKADVANFSLGLDGNDINADPTTKALLKELEVKVGKAINASPALYVFAAGNEARKVSDINYPAAFKFANTLTVGSLKSKKEVSWFSNFGNKVDVYVRGSNVRSAVPDNGLETLSGTSMATPLVANLAAKVKVLCPHLKANELKKVLLATSMTKSLPVEPKEDATKNTPVEYREVKVISFSNTLKWAESCAKSLK